jgi:hypothetical protein
LFACAALSTHIMKKCCSRKPGYLSGYADSIVLDFVLTHFHSDRATLQMTTSAILLDHEMGGFLKITLSRDVDYSLLYIVVLKQKKRHVSYAKSL